MSKIVVFVAGQGGHFSQFERLYELYTDHNMGNSELLITDELMGEGSFTGSVIEVGELRPKNGFSFPALISHLARCFGIVKELKRHERITLISTGPGISIVCSLLVKLYGGTIIHIETWSRFYSRSFTGKFMYHLADKFYVQNSELLSLYPKAKYSGRL
jgi:UDP-N-acetylglucosamine:LPS N-acetylglucosamine transferase